MNSTDLPIYTFLKSPRDTSDIRDQNIVFEWTRRELRVHASHFRLRIAGRLAGQSPEEAMLKNAPAFESEIMEAEYASVQVNRLRGTPGHYVWQVIGYRHSAASGLTAVVASEFRTFRTPDDLPDLIYRISSDPMPAGQDLAGGGAGSCFNGDLEQGNLQGWQAYYGSRLNSATINLNSLQSGILNGRHTIRSLSDGNDPLIGLPLPQVGEGSYSVRLGNSAVNGEADVLAFTFVPATQYFTFRYAVVLQDGGHPSGEQPFFTYYLLKGSSIFFTMGNVPFASRQVIADTGNPFFRVIGDLVYRPWTPVCIDVSKYIGQAVTVVFATADCSHWGGHFGYAYIDGLCKDNSAISSFTMPSEICGGQELWADGSSSVNDTSSFWSIEESDANYGRNPGTEVFQWFVGQSAGPISLSALYASKGGQFKCNFYYRIKLAVTNDCTAWNETVHLLHIKCPPVTAGPDLCVSCKPNGQVIQLGVGNPSTAGTTYVWSPAAGLDNPTIPSPFHAVGTVAYPITYSVTATDPGGCTNTDQVTLYCTPPLVRIAVHRDCCVVTLTAGAVNYQTLAWSTGESDVLSIIAPTAGTYTVTATNPCGSATASVVVPQTSTLTGPFNPIAADSRFNPPSGATNLPDKMYIKDVIVGGGAQGVPGAYNATDYKLEIFDRWGSLFRTITGHNCAGFSNWDISWDGTDQSGNLVQQDVYSWVLHLKNCQYQEWTLPKMRRFDQQCVKWATLFGIRLWCRQRVLVIIDEVLTAGSVDVVR